MSNNFKIIPDFPNYECTAQGQFRNATSKGFVLATKESGGKAIRLKNASGSLLQSTVESLVKRTWGDEANVPKPEPVKVAETKSIKEKLVKKVQTPTSSAVEATKESKEVKKQAVLEPLTPNKEEYAKKVITAKASETKRIWLLHKFGFSQEQINSVLKTKKAAYVIWLYSGNLSRQEAAEKVQL